MVCTAPTRDCVTVCLDIPAEKMIDDDGAQCEFIDDAIPCISACNGTCIDDINLVTELGAVFITTQSTAGSEPTIEMYAKLFLNLSNLLVL